MELRFDRLRLYSREEPRPTTGNFLTEYQSFNCIAEFRTKHIKDAQCFTLSASALVVYDWMVTLPCEVQLFWTGKARPLSAILYFSTKYFNVLSQVMSLLAFAPSSDKGCTRVNNVTAAILRLSLLPPAAFSALRAYALSHNRWLSALVFILSSVQFLTNMVTFRFEASSVYSPIKFLGCLVNTDITSTIFQIFLIMDRGSAVLADIMLIAMTWKLRPDLGIRNRNLQDRPTRIKGLASIMLLNGLIYFIVLSIVNILHLLLTELSGVAVSGGPISPFTIFTTPLSSILVSRFLLDLQEAHQRPVVGLATNGTRALQISQSTNHSLNFANTLGSLGATIGPTNYGREEDDEGALADDYVAAPENIRPTREGSASQESRIEYEIAITEVTVSRGMDDATAITV